VKAKAVSVTCQWRGGLPDHVRVEVTDDVLIIQGERRRGHSDEDIEASQRRGYRDLDPSLHSQTSS